jgi:hypothetical protein
MPREQMIEHEDVFIDGSWTVPADPEPVELEDPSREEVFAGVGLADEQAVAQQEISARCSR